MPAPSRPPNWNYRRPPRSAGSTASLQRAGVTQELQIIDGMPHAFLQLFQLDGCQTGWRLMLDYLRWQARRVVIE